MRLSRDGLTPISDHGMNDWFADNLKLADKILGTYDKKKSLYNVTLFSSTQNEGKRTNVNPGFSANEQQTEAKSQSLLGLTSGSTTTPSPVPQQPEVIYDAGIPTSDTGETGDSEGGGDSGDAGGDYGG